VVRPEAVGVAVFKPVGQLPVVPGPFGLTGMRRKGAAEKRRLRKVVVAAEQARLAVNALADPTQFAKLGSKLVPPAQVVPISKNSSSKATVLSGMREHLWSSASSYVRGCGSYSGSGQHACTPPDPKGSPSVPLFCKANLYLYSSQGVKTDAKFLKADNVDLPDVAATADLLSLLPDKLRHKYSKEENVVTEVVPSFVPKVSSMVESDEDYVAIVRTLLRLGMVRFLRKAKCVNGIFGVRKGDTDALRFIANLVPGNTFFEEPEKLSLPGPDLLAQLHTTRKELFVYKYDVRAFFHRIRTPRWMHKYFCLKPLPARLFGLGKGLVFPALTTLPMGFAHAPLLAQSVHEEVLRRAGLLDLDRICLDNDRCLDRTRYGLYIDDGFGFSPCEREANAMYNASLQALDSAGLSCKASKCVPPTKGTVKLLGLQVEGATATMGPAPQELRELVLLTEQILQQDKASGRQLEKIVGKWSWFLLCNRLGFSVFSAVYGFIKSAGDNVKQFWPSVQKDLLLVCGFAPLLSVKWSQDWSGEVSAFDASLKGQGVSELVMPEEVVQSFLPFWKKSPSVPEHREQLEKVGVFVKSLPWQHVVSSRFKYEDDIDKLEAAALFTAVKRTLKRSGKGQRFLVFGDNSPVVAAMSKGRCSSFRLLVSIRKIAAWCLAFGARPLVVWVPSKCNPADEPSRMC
jgi:hypothetical protein